jgi:putative ABC transport system permease protein
MCRVAVVLACISLWSCSNKPPATTYRLQPCTLNSNGAPETIQGAAVTSAFFPSTQAVPLFGRMFLPTEYHPGPSSVVLIGNRLWKRKFGGDPALLGRTLRFNDRDFTVIGIMPASFESPAGAEIWVPAEN